MMTEHKRTQIARLLSVGYKMSEVEKICGVTRRTVVRIRQGATVDELNSEERPAQQVDQADDEDDPNPSRRQLQIAAREMLAQGYRLDLVVAIFGDVI